MKAQKMKDIRELSVPELQQKVRDADEEMFKLRLQQASRQLADTSRIRVLRRDKARYMTLLSQKKVPIAPESSVSTAVSKTAAVKEK